MAARLETPTDTETGIPFVILPRDDLPPVPTRRQSNRERRGDLHHPFHPKNELLHRGLAGAALRHSRVQWVDYDDHHHKYHAEYMGPAVPETDEAVFQTVVPVAAGYVPPEAIAFGPLGKPYRAPLNDVQRQRLWNTREIRVANPAAVRNFMTDFALRHDFGGINESTIDEFLNTASEARRNELGGTLLAIAAYDAANLVEGVYRESRRRGLIPPERARHAGRFIFSAITSQRSKPAFTALTSRLERQFTVA
jgi:hypothetical protein